MAELFPTDVFVEVLQRLPSSARRRSRLVCRLWRDTVDTRTTEMQSRPRTLVATKESVRLIEDLPSSSPSSSDGSPPRSRDLWAGDTCKGMDLVDTCNGLVCMCDNRKPGGPITLANPVTGEILAIPPLPLSYPEPTRWSFMKYGFGYLPTTGRYKVVHVSSSLDQIWVFTLGKAVWRAVATDSPEETYDPDTSHVSVDGTMYWVVKEPGAKVMSFDLDTEHITSLRTLPNVLLVSTPGIWHLIEVRGKLGIAFSPESSPRLDRTEVWIMQHDMAGQCTWSRWYSVHMQKVRPRLRQHELAHPNFIYDGEYILTVRRESGAYVLYKHKPSNGGKKAQRRVVVEIHKRNKGTVVAGIKSNYMGHRTFAYVETTEGLSSYRCW